MREDSLEEFEAVFQKASIPVLEIQKVNIQGIAVVLADYALDNSILDIAAHLKKRFSSKVTLHWPDSMNKDVVKKSADAHGAEPAAQPYGSHAELIGQIAIGKSNLVLSTEPDETKRRSAELDALVESATPPVLVIRRPVNDPASVFRKILHSLTGNFQQTRNFSYSFTLAEPGGGVQLLHAIEDHEMEDVREALAGAPSITDRNSVEVLAGMSQHGERFLKGVVAAMRDDAFDVSYRLAVGDVEEVMREELACGEYGLLVVGHHCEGCSHIAASDYQLMHQVREIPVLAL